MAINRATLVRCVCLCIGAVVGGQFGGGVLRAITAWTAFMRIVLLDLHADDEKVTVGAVMFTMVITSIELVAIYLAASSWSIHMAYGAMAVAGIIHNLTTNKQLDDIMFYVFCFGGPVILLVTHVVTHPAVVLSVTILTATITSISIVALNVGYIFLLHFIIADKFKGKGIAVITRMFGKKYGKYVTLLIVCIASCSLPLPLYVMNSRMGVQPDVRSPVLLGWLHNMLPELVTKKIPNLITLKLNKWYPVWLPDWLPKMMLPDWHGGLLYVAFVMFVIAEVFVVAGRLIWKKLYGEDDYKVGSKMFVFNVIVFLYANSPKEEELQSAIPPDVNNTWEMYSYVSIELIVMLFFTIGLGVALLVGGENKKCIACMKIPGP